MEQRRLEGKVAVVTGGAGGQGTSHATALAAHGAKVVVADIELERATAVVDAIVDRGGTAHSVSLDVRDADQWKHCIEFTEKALGPVDILVNNAGIGSAGGVEDESEDDWERVIGINQKGVWLGMRAVIESMRRAGGGSIVNTASTFAVRPPASGIAYAASKGAVRSMSRCAAMAVVDDGIRVNSLIIPMVDTPFLDRARRAGNVDKRAAEYPMKRIAQPDDVSKGVVFLASDESNYMTASELVIDGGVLGGYPSRLDK